MGHPFRSAATLLCCLLPVVGTAFAQEPIRLRTRTFVPPANLESPGRGMAATRQMALSAPMPGMRHLLVQFDGPISTDTYAAVRKAGGVPLRFVPENALSIAVPAGFSAASLPGARWAGELTPADRLSAETLRDLSAAVPARPLTIVEFHPDVSGEQARALLDGLAAIVVPLPALPPSSALIVTDAAAITALAAEDAVAWIYPAHPELESRPTAVCDGLVRPEGIVASYAGMGDGWDGPGRGAARLGFHLVRPSADLPRALQQEELRRAMAEWSRHVAVSWNESPGPFGPRSVTILWGDVDHGDGFPFAPGVLAHAFYPAPPTPEPIAGDVHFNDSLRWGVGEPASWDVFSVALHELGHSLGLVHSADPDSVMYPLYRGIVSELAPGDIDAVRAMYADPGPESPPGGWVTAAIGGDAGAGSSSEEDGRITLTSAGRDVWGTADQFTFSSRTLDGDGDIVARVDRLAGTHRWSKAGLMIRGSLDPDAAHGFVLVSTGRGAAFQRRRTAGGDSVHTAGPALAAPSWLWLSRRGDRVAAYAAAEGGLWRLIGVDTIPLPRSVAVGLAVTNHDDESVGTATFSQVTATRVLPSSWASADIGEVGRKGSVAVDGPRTAVRGAGADIWDRRDAFRFVWQPVDGDVDVVARLASVERVRPWSKAGVMIRAGLDPGAAHGFVLGSAGKGFAFQRRRERSAYSTHSGGGAGGAPEWLKLSRRGNRITAFRSADGLHWTLIDSDVVDLGGGALVGLAVSSHSAAAAAAALFEAVTISVPLD